jgi:hypothetical protein
VVLLLLVLLLLLLQILLIATTVSSVTDPYPATGFATIIIVAVDVAAAAALRYI